MNFSFFFFFFKQHYYQGRLAPAFYRFTKYRERTETTVTMKVERPRSELLGACEESSSLAEVSKGDTAVVVLGSGTVKLRASPQGPQMDGKGGGLMNSISRCKITL